MSPNTDFWVRELSRTGLPAPEQQELLQRLSWALETRTKYPPDSPLAFVGSMKELLLSNFLPQKGPKVIANAPGMASEVFSRSTASELAYSELSMLDAKNRLLDDLHAMLVDVICLMARNEFPLAVPPRWLAGLFGMVNRSVFLEMLANKWSL